MESCEGMGAEDTREYVAELVTQQLNVPGFELLPEQVRCPSLCATRLATLTGQGVLLWHSLWRTPTALPATASLPAN